MASYNTLCPKIDKGAELRLEDRHVIKIRDKLGSDSGIRDRYALDREWKMILLKFFHYDFLIKKSLSKI